LTVYRTWQCSFPVPYTLETYHSLLGRPDTHVVGRSGVSWRGQPHTEWVLDTTCGYGGSKARIGLFAQPDRPGLICGIRWYDLENLPQWVEETVVEYEADGGPWPAPKAIDEWHADKTKWLSDKSAAYERWRATRTEFSLWRRRPLGPPGEEFTLSHYNLPEPKQVPTKPGLGPGGSGRPAFELGPFGPSPAPPIEVPDPEEPSLLSDLVELAGVGVWPWLTVGSILVVAASIYIRYRIRAGSSEA
jgi:hypothetical protein